MEPGKHTPPVSQSSIYILVFLWSFIGGVLASSFIFISPLVSLLVIAISVAIFIVERINQHSLSNEVVCIVLVLLAFGVGSLRYAIKDFHELKFPSREGVVVSELEHRETGTRFVFQADNGERVLVSTDMYNFIEYGDRVSVSGKLERPGVIEEEDGRHFDYGAFLAKDDIYYTMSFAKVEDLRQRSGPRSMIFRRALLEIKYTFVQRMKLILPEPESSLLAGLVVAGKQALPKSILEEFKKAGVVHIVVLSGYNITIVAEFFIVMLSFLSLRRRTFAASLGIILFILMAGASASIVRAGIMALVVLLGKMTHRQYSAPRALLLAAVLMVLENPKILVFDPSFQLSFLAMLALIYVDPLVRYKLANLTLPDWLVALLSTTLATQIVVLPYLLYNVGSVSVVSLLSNILILVFVPVTMLVGFVATLVAFVSIHLAWPLSLITHFLLAWILGVAHMLGNLPWASISFYISAIYMWVLYILMIYTVIYIGKKESLSAQAKSMN